MPKPPTKDQKKKELKNKVEGTSTTEMKDTADKIKQTLTKVDDTTKQQKAEQRQNLKDRLAARKAQKNKRVSDIPLPPMHSGTAANLGVPNSPKNAMADGQSSPKYDFFLINTFVFSFTFNFRFI